MKPLLLLLSFQYLSTASPVAIPAATTKGTPIGVFNDGDVVTVRYVSGQWSRRWQNPPESPDSTSWKEIRVVVYSEDGAGKRQVIGMPTGTYVRPFRFIAAKGNHYIRMCEPRDSGVGVVFYDVDRKLVTTK